MVDIERSVEFLPHRNELRYEIPHELAAKALQLLALNFDQDAHDSEWTQTLHFADAQLATPSDYLVRARRYEQTGFDSRFDLNPSDDWFMELKLNSGHKSRKTMPLQDILLATSQPENDAIIALAPHTQFDTFDAPMQPVAAVESHRTHFLDDSVRITVDQKLSYYGFKWGSLHGQSIGQGAKTKIEAKVFNSSSVETQESIAAFNNLLAQLDASPLPDGAQEKALRSFYKEYLKNNA